MGAILFDFCMSSPDITPIVVYNLQAPHHWRIKPVQSNSNECGVQSTGESDKFSAEPGKGRSVSDMMMQALADAMMSQMHGRVWNSSSDGAAETTVATGSPTIDTTASSTPTATPTESSASLPADSPPSTLSPPTSSGAENGSSSENGTGVIGGPAGGSSGASSASGKGGSSDGS